MRSILNLRVAADPVVTSAWLPSYSWRQQHFVQFRRALFSCSVQSGSDSGFFLECLPVASRFSDEHNSPTSVLGPHRTSTSAGAVACYRCALLSVFPRPGRRSPRCQLARASDRPHGVVRALRRVRRERAGLRDGPVAALFLRNHFELVLRVGLEERRRNKHRSLTGPEYDVKDLEDGVVVLFLDDDHVKLDVERVPVQIFRNGVEAGGGPVTLGPGKRARLRCRESLKSAAGLR